MEKCRVTDDKAYAGLARFILTGPRHDNFFFYFPFWTFIFINPQFGNNKTVKDYVTASWVNF